MFGKKRREEAKEREREARQERYRRQQREGAELYKRMADLHRMDRAKVPEAVMLLLKDAQHQVALIRQSIADRTNYRPWDSGELSEGDLATWLAENIADMMRENVTNPQTFFQAMSEQIPDVHFTVTWQDACALLAAEIRVERITGVIEGLKLGGLTQGDRANPQASV